WVGFAWARKAAVIPRSPGASRGSESHSSPNERTARVMASRMGANSVPNTSGSVKKSSKSACPVQQVISWTVRCEGVRVNGGGLVDPVSPSLREEFVKQGAFVLGPSSQHTLGLFRHHIPIERGGKPARSPRVPEDPVGDLARREEITGQCKLRLVTGQGEEIA